MLLLLRANQRRLVESDIRDLSGIWGKYAFIWLYSSVGRADIINACVLGSNPSGAAMDMISSHTPPFAGFVTRLFSLVTNYII